MSSGKCQVELKVSKWLSYSASFIKPDPFSLLLLVVYTYFTLNNLLFHITDFKEFVKKLCNTNIEIFFQQINVLGQQIRWLHNGNRLDRQSKYVKIVDGELTIKVWKRYTTLLTTNNGYVRE